MDMVKIGSFLRACKSSCHAIIDTGTSLIGGPPEDIDAINNLIGATESKYGEYVVDCDLVEGTRKGAAPMPDVTLVFGGQLFSVPAKEYVLKLPDEEGGFMCLSGFMKLNIGGWVIGDIFLRRFYVGYDLERGRVGFAHRKALV